MSSILKESDFLWQNGCSQSWDVPREDSMCSDRSDWQFSQWNGMMEMRLPTCCANWVCSSLMPHHTPSSGRWGTSAEASFIQTILSSKMPLLVSRICPFRRCARRGGVASVLRAAGPGLPHWWQGACCLCWLFGNPYLIHNTYPQEELPQNRPELRDQVELHDLAQVGVVLGSMCFKLEVGEKEREYIRHTTTFWHSCYKSVHLTLELLAVLVLFAIRKLVQKFAK